MPMCARAVVLGLALLWPVAASAASLVYQTTLSGAAENPAVTTPGTGTATVTLDTATHELTVDIVFSGLIGTTTIAHIHCCIAAPGNVGVASPTPTFPGFPAGVTAGSYLQTFDLTQTASWNAAFVTANGGSLGSAEAALAAGLAAGMAYVNIHTTSFGAGEIRGFLVPEPSTATLVGGGLAVLAARRRRRAD